MIMRNEFRLKKKKKSCKMTVVHCNVSDRALSTVAPLSLWPPPRCAAPWMRAMGREVKVRNPGKLWLKSSLFYHLLHQNVTSHIFFLLAELMEDCPQVPASIAERYKVGRMIGDGNFAVVRECMERSTGREYALKIINKSKCRGKVRWL